MNTLVDDLIFEVFRHLLGGPQCAFARTCRRIAAIWRKNRALLPRNYRAITHKVLPMNAGRKQPLLRTITSYYVKMRPDIIFREGARDRDAVGGTIPAPGIARESGNEMFYAKLGSFGANFALTTPSDNLNVLMIEFVQNRDHIILHYERARGRIIVATGNDNRARITQAGAILREVVQNFDINNDKVNIAIDIIRRYCECVT